MQPFETIDDVKEWLDPLGYDAFWRAVLPLALMGEDDRAHCDRTVANGIATYETVLTVLKGIVRLELTDQLGLRPRPTAPPTVFTVVD